MKAEEALQLAKAYVRKTLEGGGASKGEKGDPGQDGKDGITPTIGENGNWYLGDTDTGKPSRGEKGDTGLKGDKGDKGDKGETGAQGEKGATGAKGADGKTPVKGTDYWTEADKQEIVNDVLAQIPNGNEVAY